MNQNDAASLHLMNAGDIEGFADVIARVKREEFGAEATQQDLCRLETQDLSEKSSRKGATFFVVKTNGRIVGGAGIISLAGATDTCELEKLFVLQEARGQGIGRRLVDSCLEAAREHSFRHCYLETMSRMTAARELYINAGFRAIDRPLRNAPVYLDYWMVRDLTCS